MRDAIFNLQRALLLVHALGSGEHGDLREALRDRWHQPARAALVPGLSEALELEDEAVLGACLSGAGPSIVMFTAGRAAEARTRLGEIYQRLGWRVRSGSSPPINRLPADHRLRPCPGRSVICTSRFAAICARPSTPPKRCGSAASAWARSKWSTTTPPSRRAVSREKIARPAEEPVALSRAAADRRRAAHRVPFGLHAARQGRPPGGAAGRARALREGRLGQPSDLFLQGPRRRRSPRRAPWSSASPTFACASTGNLANSVAAHAARLGLSCSVFIPDDLEPAKVAGAGVYRPHDHRRPRQLRRREPAVHAGGGPVRLGLREHQPARVLRRGREDLRLRDRRAARLEVPAARRLAGGRRHAAAAHPEGLRGAAHGRPGRRRPAGDLRRAGGRLRAGRARARGRAGVPRSGQAEDDREVDRDRQPGRRLPGAARGPRRPAAAARWSPTTRSSPGSSCWPRPKGSSPSRPAASTVAATKKMIERGTLPRDESIVICVTGNGYKTSRS